MSGTRDGGRLARLEGERFEDMLHDIHGLYMAQGRAYCIKNAQPFRMLGGMDKGGTFRACFTGDGPPDWVVITRWRTYVIEQKRTQQTRWGFQNLKPHQADHLDRAEAVGACGVILLRFVIPQPWTFAIRWKDLAPTWHAWADRVSRHMGPKVRASLSPEQVAEEFGCWDGHGADYLSGLQVTEPDDSATTGTETANAEGRKADPVVVSSRVRQGGQFR